MNNSDIMEALDRVEKLPHDSLEGTLAIETLVIFVTRTIVLS